MVACVYCATAHPHLFRVLCVSEPMIELITGARIGIMSILDEEIIVPGGSDAGFLEKLGENQVPNRSARCAMDGFLSGCYLLDFWFNNNPNRTEKQLLLL